MLTFQTGKVKIILNLTEGKDPIILSELPKIVIRNVDNNTFWNGTIFQSDYISINMLFDSIMNYYYYSSENIELVGYYETLLLSNDELYGFRKIEQFKIIIKDDPWETDLTNYTTSLTAGEQQTLTRKLGTNLAVISEDWFNITIYDDDGITPLHIYTLSTDKRIRTPN